MKTWNLWEGVIRQSDGETGAAPVAEPTAQPPETPVADAEIPVSGEAPPPEPADSSSKPPQGLLDRIGQLTRQKRELEERLAQEQAYRQQQYVSPQGQPEGQYVDPRNIELEIQHQAMQLAKQQSWKDTTDRVWNEGLQKYGDWASQLNMMAQVLGGIPPSLTEAAIETGTPHEVLYHLAKNPDEAAKIAMLPPTKQAVAVAKVAQTLGSPRRVSSAPPPISPKVSGSGQAPASLDDPNLSMEEWARLRNQEERARRKGR